MQLEKLNWFEVGTEARSKGISGVDFEDDGFGPVEEKENVEVVTEPENLSLPKVREDMRKSLPAEYLGKFAVSISAKATRRCLHLLGACHRIPGLHYLDFQVYDERPSEGEYHVHCMQCWKKDPEAEEESESEGSSSTENDV